MADLADKRTEAFATAANVELGAIFEPRRGQVRLSVIADDIDEHQGEGNAMVFLSAADARRLGWDLHRAARLAEEAEPAARPSEHTGDAT